MKSKNTIKGEEKQERKRKQAFFIFSVFTVFFDFFVQTFHQITSKIWKTKNDQIRKSEEKEENQVIIEHSSKKTLDLEKECDDDCLIQSFRNELCITVLRGSAL